MYSKMSRVGLEWPNLDKRMKKKKKKTKRKIIEFIQHS